jgi:hypothetical protein
MPVKAYMLVVAVLLSALPPAARADLHDAVNWARVQGCARSIRIPLRDSPKLRLAAQQMATGMSLHAALLSAGYLAAQSSAVHLSGCRRPAMQPSFSGKFWIWSTDPGRAAVAAEANRIRRFRRSR